MFVRFNRNVDAGGGNFYESSKSYDLDKRLADRFIAEGQAAATTNVPEGYNSNLVTVTGGTINGTPIGATTRASGQFTDVRITSTDSTGTPGNVTNNSANGRAAFAAAASTCVVTNSLCAATDTVQVTLLGAADATLDRIVGVTVAAGSFTVTGNAAATATKGFMFTLIKQ